MRQPDRERKRDRVRETDKERERERKRETDELNSAFLKPLLEQKDTVEIKLHLPTPVRTSKSIRHGVQKKNHVSRKRRLPESIVHLLLKKKETE